MEGGAPRIKYVNKKVNLKRKDCRNSYDFQFLLTYQRNMDSWFFSEAQFTIYYNFSQKKEPFFTGCKGKRSWFPNFWSWDGSTDCGSQHFNCCLESTNPKSWLGVMYFLYFLFFLHDYMTTHGYTWAYTTIQTHTNPYITILDYTWQYMSTHEHMWPYITIN